MTNNLEYLTAHLRQRAIHPVHLREINEHTDHEPIYAFQVAGSQAVSTWRILHSLVSDTGYWPVLLGTDEDLERHSEGLNAIDSAFTSSQATSLATVDAIIPEDWFRARLRASLQAYGHDFRGEWPHNIVPADTFFLPFDSKTNKPHPIINLGLVPTRESWQVPLLLDFGGWNECPYPETHASVLRYWEQRYGAQVVAMMSDSVEVAVERPPTTHDAALALAYEQFAYCEDIVTQGTETIDALAAALLNGTVWFFWWD
jgi:hypothetical protein